MYKKSFFYPPRNFGNLDEQLSDFAKAKFLILPIPYDSTASYKAGSKDGPLAIINASSYVELYDQELGIEQHEAGIHTLPELTPFTGDSVLMTNHIYKATKELLKSKKTIIGLGGDHSVSIGLIKAHLEKYPNLSVLHFDAHSDLRNEYDGTKFGSPTVMRRALEMGAKVTQVGIRSTSKEEVLFVAKNKKVRQFFADYIIENPNYINEVIDSLGEQVYVSFDVDFFDPSIMSATGTPEPGGPDWYTALKLLREVTKQKRVVGADFVELAPDLGPHSCSFLVAKLVYKFMGFLITGKK